MILPGYTCPHCQAFNGEVKEELTQCRGCAKDKPRTLVALADIQLFCNWIVTVNRTPLLTKEELTNACKELALFILQQTGERVT